MFIMRAKLLIVRAFCAPSAVVIVHRFGAKGLAARHCRRTSVISAGASMICVADGPFTPERVHVLSMPETVERHENLLPSHRPLA